MTSSRSKSENSGKTVATCLKRKGEKQAAEKAAAKWYTGEEVAYIEGGCLLGAEPPKQNSPLELGEGGNAHR